MRMVIFIVTLIPIVCFDQCISGNCENGYGTYKYSNGNTYTGNWMNGVQHGLGRFTFANGDCQSGEWLNNKMTGKGTYLWLGGYYYTGEWQNDQMTGLGYMVYSNGAKREGNFVIGEFITPVHAISTIYSKPPYNDPNYFLNLCTGANSGASLDVGFQNTLQTVTIGTQVWISKNLDVKMFRNGDPITEAKTELDWIESGKAAEPAWCYVNNDPKTVVKYGVLYNWYAVNDPRGLAPQGWHIPKQDEWVILVDFLGGTNLAGKEMKLSEYWPVGRNGNNSSGFSAIPCGSRSSYGVYYDALSCANWWSASNYDGVVNQMNAFYRWICSDNNNIPDHCWKDKANGFSVRCVKD